jgi:glutamate racemase
MPDNKTNKNKKNIIGVFDSGLGGLTVLKEFIKLMPKYNYTYLGDTARVPYGNKSQETIYNYTKEAIDFLFLHGAQLIIIACNTASAKALRKIQQEYLPKKYPNKNVLGVIRPLAEFAGQKDIKTKENKFSKVGIIGTKSTIESHAYEHEIKSKNKDIKIFSNSAPLLVPLIEENYSQKPETKTILKQYLRNIKSKNVNLLVLGCTHYQFLIKDVKRILGKNCLVPNPGQIVAKSLQNYITNHPEYKIKENSQPKYQFYTTDDPKKFKILGEKFLGKKIKSIKKITL